MITVNPLNNLVKTIKKPDWYCDHDCVVLVNITNKNNTKLRIFYYLLIYFVQNFTQKNNNKSVAICPKRASRGDEYCSQRSN